MFLKTTVRQIWLASRGTRFSSSSTHAAKNGNQISSGLGRFSRSLLWISGASLFGFYATDSRAAIHSHVILPVLRQFSDAEESHVLAIWALKMGLHPSDRVPDDECLQTTLWGKQVSNPVGIAAGFDKNGEAIDGLLKLGWGLVEIGSITPQPQPGNPKPRMFRLVEDKAVINRYGFNSDGARVVVQRLQERLCSFIGLNQWDYSKLDSNTNKSLNEKRLLGINLGKNKWSPSESADDYVSGVKMFASYADYLVINISSPNTPGLRSMQRKEILKNLIKEVQDARDSAPEKPPLIVKIAPDLNDDELQDIASIVTELKVDGVIISNTTIQRPESLKSDRDLCQETGGLSGKPLFPLSLEAVRKFYRLTDGKVPIIGCGGISKGEDALQFLLAGASAVQIYTAFSYEGPRLVCDIKDYLVQECKRRGIKSIQELVGKGHA